MRKPRSSCKAVKFPDSVGHRLHTYTLAASAAGVTILALAPPSEGEIVYTPVQVEIGSYYDLDLTGDGTIDFELIDTWKGSNGFSWGALWAAPAQTGNGVVGYANQRGGYASALRAGFSIGPNADFPSSGRLMMAYGYRASSTQPYHPRHSCRGPWKNKRNHYLGLKFTTGGEVHYGWARLSETCDRGKNIEVLTGYAYETIPNQGIKAGRKKGKLDESLDGTRGPEPLSDRAPIPATLGMLAKGAPALSIWRPE